MRRLIISLLWLTIIILPLHAQDTDSIEATTTARLKLRAGPGLEWAVLGYIERAELLILDGRDAANSWWIHVITTDQREGWVYGEFVAVTGNELRSLPLLDVDEHLLLTPTVTPADGIPQATVNIRTTSNIVSGLSDNARSIFLRGQELGNRANVFSKVGDSITASRHFLFPIGWGTYNLGDYTHLQAVVNYFSSGSARGGNNSFANPSLAAYDGLTTAGVLDPSSSWKEICQAEESPLECEYRLNLPAVALIMLGTNDVAILSSDAYRGNLERIVQISIDRGVVPVLSLIPIRVGYESSVAVFNQIITDVARGYDIPLWHFNLSDLDNNGLVDGVHPSWPGSAEDYAASVDLSADHLRYGYPVRNLSALQALDAIWRGVLY